ncbi:bZIP transcription factor [Aspergillus affinis]|uniref:bZIP transcription factor n=1 Tax=Aspergillus affinis TaxID=1070780 RepID=UPI0022FE8D54|nr:uncharacterized protein KD926_006013 [Aspergillus affinis]KAI9046066.1 hypothetical protein KD926_006013 [Aspergillus affinis]
MDSIHLMPNSPLYDWDSPTEGSAPVTASSSPASRLTDIQVFGGSLPQSPDLWADFMFSDSPYHPTTACGLLPVTSPSHGALADQTLVDQLVFGLDPLIVPQAGFPEIDLSAGELIPTMPESRFTPTPMMASLLPLNIDQSPAVSSPRSDPRGSQPTFSRSSKVRQRERSSPNAEEWADDGSLSPGSEEGRLQERRRRNKLASRKLRQKHLDHVSDLESRLGAVTQERDELRLRVAKWEGEVMALRKLLENRADDSG